MVQRKTIEREGSEDRDVPVRAVRSAEPWPVVVWIHEGPVCVSIIDEAPQVHESACRCGGCHASAQADLAANFLPD